MNKSLKLLLKFVRTCSPKPERNQTRLVTIGLSHFAEKSRWALDLSPLAYKEEVHCPAFHLSSTLLSLSKMKRFKIWNDKEFDDNVSNRVSDPKLSKMKDMTAVPKLVLPPSSGDSHSSVVDCGSSGILKYLAVTFPSEMGGLYPDGQLGRDVLELESLIDRELGSIVTAWSFGCLLLTGTSFAEPEAGKIPQEGTNSSSRDFFISCVTKNKQVPMVERMLFRILGRYTIIPLMISANRISAVARGDARKRIVNFFDCIDKQYFSDPTRNPHEFIFRTSYPTAADISLCALSMPLLLPSEIRSSFASLEDFNEMQKSGVNAQGCRYIVELARELEEKFKSARYVLHMYKTMRPPLRV
jgi:hypothetical protein